MGAMDREALHAQIASCTHWEWRRRALFHALIDAGAITEFRCQECYVDDPLGFVWDVHRHALEPVIDHIMPRAQGGGDRMENFQFVHRKCNTLRAVMRPEALEHLRQCRLAEGGWQRAIDVRKPGWNRKVRADDKRRGSVPALTPARAREARARFEAGGETFSSIARAYGISHPTAKLVCLGLDAYADSRMAA